MRPLLRIIAVLFGVVALSAQTFPRPSPRTSDMITPQAQQVLRQHGLSTVGNNVQVSVANPTRDGVRLTLQNVASYDTAGDVARMRGCRGHATCSRAVISFFAEGARRYFVFCSITRPPGGQLLFFRRDHRFPQTGTTTEDAAYTFLSPLSSDGGLNRSESITIFSSGADWSLSTCWVTYAI